MRGSATARGVREAVMRAERAKTARPAVGVHDRCQGAGLCQRQRPTRACRRRETALYLYWVTWETPRHSVPRRDRPIEPWSTQTGAAHGASRPGLRKPIQLFGAVEPVSARAGRQEFLWLTYPVVLVLMSRKPSEISLCAPPASAGPYRMIPVAS